MSNINDVRIKFDPYAGMNIDDCYSQMLEFCSKIMNTCIDFHCLNGMNNVEVFCEFNGQEFTTSMSLDECYKAVTGHTKEEWNEIERKAKEETERKEQEFQEKMPSMVEAFLEEAKPYIDESLHKELEEIAPIRFSDIYHGSEMKAMLDIIKLYKETNSMYKCAELFYNQGHSGWSAGLVASLLREFHSKELGDYVCNNSLNFAKKNETND